MLYEARGDIFETHTDGIVIPVNCVGVMGAGLAKAFRERDPLAYQAYRLACSQGDVRLGRCFVYRHALRGLGAQRVVFMLPTKLHWLDRSHLGDIIKGLDDLVMQVVCSDIISIAVPALGCGLRGLAWHDVQPVINDAFEHISDRYRIYVYPPRSTQRI